MAKQQLGPLQREWIQRLRGGKYKQGKGLLRSFSDEYCCLGVACAIAEEHGIIGPPKELTCINGYAYGDKQEAAMLPDSVREAFQFRTKLGDLGSLKHGYLAGLNDKADWTFAQIADLAEQYPEQVFNAPA